MNILLISYDNESHLPFFPLNIYYLMAHLGVKHPEIKVALWSQDLHHGKESALTDILDKHSWDIVGVGACAGYYQYRKLQQISSAVNAAKNRGRFCYLLGGHGPGGAPGYFVEKYGADAVVVGDGEEGIDRVIAGERGIICGVPCEKYPPVAAYESFKSFINVYRLIRWPTSTRTDFCFPILSSRGCKFNCSFCFRMRAGYHLRNVGEIVEEMRYLKAEAGITHFQFADELLMASEERTVEVCEAIVDLKTKWDCNGRLNYATPEVLRTMSRAGCQYVNYGIESLSQKMLNGMHKGLTVEQITRGVAATITAGISPGLNFVWGFPGDTQRNLTDAVRFLINYDPCDELRTIRPVTPYPGCALYNVAVEKGLLSGPDDFYQKHVNSDAMTVNFTDIPDDRFHYLLGQANLELHKNYCDKNRRKVEEAAKTFYVKPSSEFRGWRPV